MNWYLVFSLIAVVFCLFMMFRTHHIHKQRMAVLDNEKPYLSLYNFERLQSFDYMMWRVWVWDIKHFPKRTLR
jgi:hypothetical protein